MDALKSGREVVLAWRKNFPRHEVTDAIAQCIRQCVLPGVEMYPDSNSKPIKLERMQNTMLPHY
jgi:hypothetical protein